MAVPKKRTSKAKKNARKANWKNQARVEAQKALSLAKSVLTRKSNGFVYNPSETADTYTN
uniref:Large ribosomal subunit protein bL32c n=1 Tax=Pyropia haitanensis TaxID=1262161 RepID=M9PR45_PYRHA|nr:ribosomal protein L32 [Neoporphyra haitanensis]AGG36984.1 ribosomal protein L32 [Neoporphyra haitanensis]